MFNITGKVSKTLGDGEVDKEPEVTHNPPSIVYTIDISISPIEFPHDIVQGNPNEDVTSIETDVANEKHEFIDQSEGRNNVSENLNESDNLY